MADSRNPPSSPDHDDLRGSFNDDRGLEETSLGRTEKLVERPEAIAGPSKSPIEQENKSHPWMWGATGVIITILATVSWLGLFVIAAFLYAVGIFKAPWFRRSSRTTRGVLKAAIVVIICILLFVAWWFIPRPDIVANLRKTLRLNGTPSPTAIATPMAVATPTPQLVLTQPRPQRSPTEQATASASSPAYTSLPPPADPLARGAIHCEVIAHGIVVSKNANGTLYSVAPSIAEAIIVAHNQKTKKDYKGATNSAGIVSLSVPPGLYFVTASHPGFKESTFLSLARNVVVKDSEYASVTIYLEPLESPTP